MRGRRAFLLFVALNVGVVLLATAGVAVATGGGETTEKVVDGYRVALTMVEPVRTGPNEVTISLTDPSGKPVEDSSITVAAEAAPAGAMSSDTEGSMGSDSEMPGGSAGSDMEPAAAETPAAEMGSAGSAGGTVPAKGEGMETQQTPEAAKGSMTEATPAPKSDAVMAAESAPAPKKDAGMEAETTPAPKKDAGMEAESTPAPKKDEGMGEEATPAPKTDAEMAGEGESGAMSEAGSASAMGSEMNGVLKANKGEPGEYSGMVDFPDPGMALVKVRFEAGGNTREAVFDAEVIRSGPDWTVLGAFLVLNAALVMSAGIMRQPKAA